MFLQVSLLSSVTVHNNMQLYGGFLGALQVLYRATDYLCEL
jgi:hypothetical protein